MKQSKVEIFGREEGTLANGSKPPPVHNQGKASLPKADVQTEENQTTFDPVEEASRESFPASDAPGWVRN